LIHAAASTAGASDQELWRCVDMRPTKASLHPTPADRGDWAAPVRHIVENIVVQ